jgi:hypothetical protein
VLTLTKFLIVEQALKSGSVHIESSVFSDVNQVEMGELGAKTLPRGISSNVLCLLLSRGGRLRKFDHWRTVFENLIKMSIS